VIEESTVGAIGAATDTFLEEKLGISDFGRCVCEVMVLTLVCLKAEWFVWLVSSYEVSNAVVLVSQSSSFEVVHATTFRVFFFPVCFKLKSFD
jgi:hypothetical protein